METTLYESLNSNLKCIDLFGHNTARAKNTPIADIKYSRLDTCRFILAPKGLEGPSAVGGKLNPPVLELELLSKYSMIIKEFLKRTITSKSNKLRIYKD